MTPPSGAAGTAGPPRSRTVRYTAAAVGAVVVLLVVLLVTRDPAGERSTASPVVGKRAPGLAGDALIGSSFDVGENDSWLVVNFFATWCGPCVQEHPELVKFAKAHDDGSAQVVSVVYSDRQARVKQFFARRGGDWTVLDSDEGQTALDWGVAKIPESFLVSPSGVVVERFDDGAGVTREQLDSYIEAYEQQASGAGGP